MLGLTVVSRSASGPQTPQADCPPPSLGQSSWLCDLGPVTWPLWASATFPVQRESQFYTATKVTGTRGLSVTVILSRGEVG